MMCSSSLFTQLAGNVQGRRSRVAGSRSRVRIAITTNTLSAGGAERQRVLLANGLAQRGHDVQLVALQQMGPLEADVAPAVDLRGAWREGAVRTCDVLVTGTTNTETAAGVRVRYIQRRARAWAAAVHNPMGPGAPPLKRFALCAVRLADAVVALSDWHATEVRRRLHLRVSNVIPNGVDTDHFSDTREARKDVNKFEFDVGFLGRLSAHHKGLDVLLEAWRDQSRRLAIAGVGEDEKQLRRSATSAGLDDRVSWLGFSRPDEFFRRVELLVLPSRFEGQPMVVLEGLAAGVPVIASRAGGMASLLDDERVIEPVTPRRLSNVVDDYFATAVATRRSLRVHVPNVSEMVEGYEALALSLLRDRVRTADVPA